VQKNRHRLQESKISLIHFCFSRNF
jgi:hypothetical protein